VVRGRYYRNHYGAEQNQVDVLGDDVGEPRNVAKQEPTEGEPRAPDQRTDQVVERVLAVVHVPDTRGNRCESANDRYEPCDDHGKATKAFKEVVGAHDVGRAEEAALFAFEHARAKFVTNQVAELTARKSRDADHEAHDVDRNVDAFGLRGHGAREGQQPGNDEQGVARQHKPDEQTGFSEDDEADDDERPRSEGLDDDARIEPRDQRSVVDGVSFVRNRGRSGVVTGY
jgi:hypothetical protein